MVYSFAQHLRPARIGPAPFDVPKMAPMLQLHNGSFGIAAMQHSHDWHVTFWNHVKICVRNVTTIRGVSDHAAPQKKAYLGLNGHGAAYCGGWLMPEAG